MYFIAPDISERSLVVAIAWLIPLPVFYKGYRIQFKAQLFRSPLPLMMLIRKSLQMEGGEDNGVGGCWANCGWIECCCTPCFVRFIPPDGVQLNLTSWFQLKF